MLKTILAASVIGALTITSAAFAKGHNNGVKDVVAAVKAGTLTLDNGFGNTAPVAPGDGDAADTAAIDRNSKEYTSQVGNPGRSDGSLPGLKR